MADIRLGQMTIDQVDDEIYALESLDHKSSSTRARIAELCRERGRRIDAEVARQRAAMLKRIAKN